MVGKHSQDTEALDAVAARNHRRRDTDKCGPCPSDGCTGALAAADVPGVCGVPQAVVRASAAARNRAEKTCRAGEPARHGGSSGTSSGSGSLSRRVLRGRCGTGAGPSGVGDGRRAAVFGSLAPSLPDDGEDPGQEQCRGREQHEGVGEESGDGSQGAGGDEDRSRAAQDHGRCDADSGGQRVVSPRAPGLPGGVPIRCVHVLGLPVLRGHSAQQSCRASGTGASAVASESMEAAMAVPARCAASMSRTSPPGWVSSQVRASSREAK